MFWLLLVLVGLGWVSKYFPKLEDLMEKKKLIKQGKSVEKYVDLIFIEETYDQAVLIALEVLSSLGVDEVVVDNKVLLVPHKDSEGFYIGGYTYDPMEFGSPERAKLYSKSWYFSDIDEFLGEKWNSYLDNNILGLFVEGTIVIVSLVVVFSILKILYRYFSFFINLPWKWLIEKQKNK
jgi:hypothetical protein